MTVQDWEAADSTALLINLKLGILPLRESLVAGRKAASEENRLVVPFESTRTRLAGLGRWLIGKKHGSRRSPHQMESTRRHLRLVPHLRLVWSGREIGQAPHHHDLKNSYKRFQYQCSSDQFS